MQKLWKMLTGTKQHIPLVRVRILPGGFLYNKKFPIIQKKNPFCEAHLGI